MINERKMANDMLNAVWDDDVVKLEDLLQYGADPNWHFNGYPILLHAVYTRNKEAMLLLIKHGAMQVEEALGFALERGIGEVIAPLVYLGVVPKQCNKNEMFGPFPARYAPLDCPKIHNYA